MGDKNAHHTTQQEGDDPVEKALQNYAASMALMFGMNPYWPACPFNPVPTWNTDLSTVAAAPPYATPENWTAGMNNSAPRLGAPHSSMLTTPSPLLASLLTNRFSLSPAKSMVPAVPKLKIQESPPDSTNDDSMKGEDYWNRRQRNNASAKKSREKRRKLDQLASLRLMQLEEENVQLKAECTTLRGELFALRAHIMGNDYVPGNFNAKM